MSQTIDKIAVLAVILLFTSQAWAWHDETHLAIAKAAGYEKWFNAAGADITKIKAGDVEKKNHYVNNPRDTVITAEMVLDQAGRYNKAHDTKGHLYGPSLPQSGNTAQLTKQENTLNTTWPSVPTMSEIYPSRFITPCTTTTTNKITPPRMASSTMRSFTICP